MDQHQHRSRSSSQSERLPSICVGDPHKPLISPLSCTAHAPSASSSHTHSHPAVISTPRSNEANVLTPSHYITTSSPSTPRRSSSVLPSPFLVSSSPVLPTLTKMSPQVLAPPPASHNPSLHDQPRPSSRSERLLRETLRRDRAASISPRSRMPSSESRPGRIASTSSEMFHCACTDSDDEGDQGHDNPLHVSLLFANLPQHQQKHAPPLQRASKSSADVQTLTRPRESHLREKEPIPSVFHLNLPPNRAAPHGQLESYVCGTAVAQARNHHPDRASTSSSPESSSLSSPTSSHRQPLSPSPSPSPPSYTVLPETSPRMANTRGRARNHTHPTSAVPLPLHPHQPQPQPYMQRQQATPPPTPPAFDARGAAAKLRTIDGYVSFANVEGLGGPPGVDEDPTTEDDRRRGTWWPWRGRSRSGSLGAT